MKLRKLLPTCFLTFGLSLTIAACDGGDDGTTSDSNAEDADTDNSGTEGGNMDVDCATFCTSFVDLCIQSGASTEFDTNDQCLEACADWDQAGINCRNEQIVAGACDQAGNMSTSC